MITLLRAPETDDVTRPQPTANELSQLIDESRAAGLAVDLRTPAHLNELDAATGRTLYRIVQEALTNVRKHAPNARVDITVDGAPGSELEVRVRNDLTRRAPTTVPGSGSGLIGLRERAELVGGRLECGPSEDRRSYQLSARLPWPAVLTPPDAPGLGT